MSDNLTVRFVAKSDFDRWLPLWDGYNAFYGRSGKTALAREITEMTWARFSMAMNLCTVWSLRAMARCLD